MFFGGGGGAPVMAGAGTPSEDNALGAPVIADGGEGIALRTVGEEMTEIDADWKSGEELANGGSGRGVRQCRRLLSAFRRRHAPERADGKAVAASGSTGAGENVVVPTGRTRSSTPSLTVKECKATRTLGVIMGAFTACWLPFFASLDSWTAVLVHHSPFYYY